MKFIVLKNFDVNFDSQKNIWEYDIDCKKNVVFNKNQVVDDYLDCDSDVKIFAEKLIKHGLVMELALFREQRINKILE
jgi:hypothetical protein